jgi:hypothetical protein
MEQEKWAREKAQEVKQRREAKREAERIKNERDLADYKLKQAHGPELWSQTRAALKSQMELFLESLGESDALVWSSVKDNDAFIEVGGSPSTESVCCTACRSSKSSRQLRAKVTQPATSTASGRVMSRTQSVHTLPAYHITIR